MDAAGNKDAGHAAPLLRSIGQLAIAVRDLDAMTRFYHETLGLPLLFTVPDRMAFVECNGVRIMLSVPEPGFDHPSSILYFRVDDIMASYTVLVSRGVQFVDEPHLVADMGSYELWLAFFRDPEQSTHALMAERPKSG